MNTSSPQSSKRVSVLQGSVIDITKSSSTKDSLKLFDSGGLSSVPMFTGRKVLDDKQLFYDLKKLFPLHFPSEFNRSNFIHQLIDLKNKDLEVLDFFGDTAIQCASRKGQAKVVALLLKSGADIESTDIEGNTSLVISSFANYIEVVEVLIENHADLDSINYDGNTALQCAAMKGHENIVALLIKKGADIEIVDKYGRVALDFANKYKREKCVEMLEEAHDNLQKDENLNEEKKSAPPVCCIVN